MIFVMRVTFLIIYMYDKKYNVIKYTWQINEAICLKVMTACGNTKSIGK
jgi:uncharacterized membrane protein